MDNADRATPTPLWQNDMIVGTCHTYHVLACLGSKDMLTFSLSFKLWKFIVAVLKNVAFKETVSRN